MVEKKEDTMFLKRNYIVVLH